jgi:phage baseplate assembly protein W
MSFIKRLKDKRKPIYSDFRKDFITSPLTQDISVRTDEESIKEALRNLMLTNKGERLFQPTLGSDIQALLFENNSPSTLLILKEAIKTTINNFEPRVGIIDVNVYSEYIEDTVKVDIVFYMQSREDPIEVTLFLERTR